jgi:hypothetical protein
MTKYSPEKIKKYKEHLRMLMSENNRQRAVLNRFRRRYNSVGDRAVFNDHVRLLSDQEALIRDFSTALDDIQKIIISKSVADLS